MLRYVKSRMSAESKRLDWARNQYGACALTQSWSIHIQISIQPFPHVMAQTASDCIDRGCGEIPVSLDRRKHGRFLATNPYWRSVFLTTKLSSNVQVREQNLQDEQAHAGVSCCSRIAVSVLIEIRGER